MDINLKNITNTLSARTHLVFRAVKEGYSGEPKPRRDWILILSTVTLLLLLSIVLNASMFVRVLGGVSLSEGVVEKGNGSITEEEVAELDDIFMLREERARTFSNGDALFIDPSR